MAGRHWGGRSINTKHSLYLVSENLMLKPKFCFVMG